MKISDADKNKIVLTFLINVFPQPFPRIQAICSLLQMFYNGKSDVFNF